MHLIKLHINNLFGHFNHKINFNDEKITIITAPNGYGKTVCLKIIDAIFNKRFTYLSNLDFSSIELYTSDNILFIKKEDLKDKDFSLSFSNSDEIYNYSKSSREVSSNSRRSGIVHTIENSVPFLRRIGPREWEDIRYDEVYNLDEVIENFSEHLSDEVLNTIYPQYFLDFIEKLEVHFIQDQRLIQRKHTNSRYNNKGYIDTIEKYADELSELIKSYGVKSALVSQNLDTSFPARLLKTDKNIENLSPEIITIELNNLQTKRKELSNFDLLSSDSYLPDLQVSSEIKPEDQKVLTLYINDTKQKLAPYEGIYKRIEIFDKILNTKRLSYKKVKFNSKKGFFFETDRGDPLNLTQLSSGEQHQIVLLYELIFKANKNVLVLIDEPELSLHVAWQKEFLNDLTKIIEIQEMPIVIATHSPQIIDSKWDLTVDLEVEEL
ncbi:AAA family ATPase [Acinetobacter sp. Z1]|uniref:AAA family ATPase n=1 Tax=Acinetobacter sp. Z1 TaxID=2953738 RepID=UPI0020CA142D|nr:AAA family ATPase [Acinetobacter sp. Z1]UTO19668.1 AAA family ATPase [Acinetobacter sp. Z1]